MSVAGRDEKEVLEVTCGPVTARLHINKFICPGIHQECIETADGIFVTPKTFTGMGEKEKLKDWKNAVRWKAKSIRKRMDAGELDFFNHEKICTGRCASRNLGASKYDMMAEKLKSDESISSTTASHSRSRRKTASRDEDLNLTNVLNYSSFSEDSFSSLRESSKESSLPLYSSQPVFPSAFMVPANREIKVEPTSQCTENMPNMDISPRSNEDFTPNDIATRGQLSPPKLNFKWDPTTNKVVSSPSQDYGEVLNLSQKMNREPESYEEKRSWKSPRTMELDAETAETIKYVSHLPDSNSLLESDSEMFWKNIHNLGLIDDFFTEIKCRLDGLRQDVIFPANGHCTASTAKRLSNVVSELGLMDQLKWKLAQAKTYTLREHDTLTLQINTLKQQVEETENKQRVLKRKSECFDKLMGLGRAKRASTDTPNSSCSSANEDLHT